MAKLQTTLLCCFFIPGYCSAQLQSTFIFGNSAWADKTLALTFFDGPDDDDPADGVSWSFKLAKTLAEWKDAHGRPLPIHATFFVNLCRFKGQDKPIPESNNCYFIGFEPLSLLADYVKFGHRVANHTADHPKLDSRPWMTDAMVVDQVSKLQHILDPYQVGQKPSLVPPNLAWSADVAAALNADGYLKARGVTGPYGCDFCGDGAIAGKKFGSDTDCMAYGFTPEQCGQVAVDAIRNSPHQKGILQLHDRPQWNVGKGKGLQEAVYILRQLPPDEFHYVFIDYVESSMVNRSGRTADHHGR